MPTNARKSRWYSTGGPWGTGLLLIGVAEVALGINYITASQIELRAALAWIDTFIPINGWGLLWIMAGAYSIAQGLLPPQRHKDLAAAVGVIFLWAGMYGAYWLLKDIHSREWTSAVAWGALGAVLMSFGRCVNPPTGRAPE